MRVTVYSLAMVVGLALHSAAAQGVPEKTSSTSWGLGPSMAMGYLMNQVISVAPLKGWRISKGFILLMATQD
jgi:hypothetical protein